MGDLARWASVRNNEVNMEEKKKEKSARAPGKATVKVCGREIPAHHYPHYSEVGVS